MTLVFSQSGDIQMNKQTQRKDPKERGHEKTTRRVDRALLEYVEIDGKIDREIER